MIPFVFMSIVCVFFAILLVLSLDANEDEKAAVFFATLVASVIVTFVSSFSTVEKANCEPQQIEQSTPIKQEMTK